MSAWTARNRPKTKELRALIGKHVAFTCRMFPHHAERIGIVREVRGFNVLIDENQSYDWHWFGAVGFSFDRLRAAPEHDTRDE